MDFSVYDGVDVEVDLNMIYIDEAFTSVLT